MSISLCMMYAVHALSPPPLLLTPRPFPLMPTPRAGDASAYVRAAIHVNPLVSHRSHRTPYAQPAYAHALQRRFGLLWAGAVAHRGHHTVGWSASSLCGSASKPPPGRAVSAPHSRLRPLRCGTSGSPDDGSACRCYGAHSDLPRRPAGDAAVGALPPWRHRVDAGLSVQGCRRPRPTAARSWQPRRQRHRCDRRGPLCPRPRIGAQSLLLPPLSSPFLPACRRLTSAAELPCACAVCFKSPSQQPAPACQAGAEP